jgi:hypothetical protein
VVKSVPGGRQNQLRPGEALPGPGDGPVVEAVGVCSACLHLNFSGGRLTGNFCGGPRVKPHEHPRRCQMVPICHRWSVTDGRSDAAADRLRPKKPV